MKKISVVIPIYNEQDNIVSLIEEIKLHLSNKFIFEIIIVDDCSTDLSYKNIKNNKEHNDVIVLKNKKNMGQSYSIHYGIKFSKFKNIVTLDGDGQNPPKDIQKIAKCFFSNKFELVGGLRLNRKDTYIKKVSSKIANKVRSSILKDNCLDTGCSLKIFNKDFFLKLPYFNGMHRFLPALFLAHGGNTFFVEVEHRIRLKGKSKYGIFDRLVRGIKDLIKVLYLINKIKNE